MKVILVSRIFAPEAAAATFRLGALVKALVSRQSEQSGQPADPAGHVQERAATQEREAAHEGQPTQVRVLTAQAPPALRGQSDPDTTGVGLSRWPVLRDATGYVRGYLPYLSFDLPLLVRLLLEPTADVVVVEPPPTTGAMTRLALALKAPRRRIPYVYYAADIWSDATASMGAPAPVVTAMRWVERFAMRGASDIIAVSEGVAQRVHALIGRQVPVQVVPNGIDTQIFTPEGPVPSDAPQAPYLVYAGTASEWQGAEIFAEAMRVVIQQEPEARLVFLGQGDRRASCRERV